MSDYLIEAHGKCLQIENELLMGPFGMWAIN